MTNNLLLQNEVPDSLNWNHKNTTLYFLYFYNLKFFLDFEFINIVFTNIKILLETTLEVAKISFFSFCVDAKDGVNGWVWLNDGLVWLNDGLVWFKLGCVSFKLSWLSLSRWQRIRNTSSRLSEQKISRNITRNHPEPI